MTKIIRFTDQIQITDMVYGSGLWIRYYRSRPTDPDYEAGLQIRITEQDTGYG